MAALCLLSVSVPRVLPRGARCRVALCAAGSTGNFELDLFSPARINIFTRILKRHDDGCHEVTSLQQAVSFGDRVLLARIPADRFAAAGVVRPSRIAEPIKQHAELSMSAGDGVGDLSAIPLDESNLVVRALALFRSRLVERDGGSLDIPRFRAHLVKRIPPDAGLGGAASNAATALWGANELCGRPASPEELTEWAQELSSDVASLLVGAGASVCSGRAVFHKPQGVSSAAPLSFAASGGNRLFLITPIGGAPLSVPRLFRLLADASYASLSTREPADLVELLTERADARSSRAGDLAAACVNDLEPPALEACPTLGAIQTHLLQDEGFHVASLVGAGPSLLAFGEPRGGGEALAERLVRACAPGSEAGAVRAIQVRAVHFARRDAEQWYAEEMA